MQDAIREVPVEVAELVSRRTLGMVELPADLEVALADNLNAGGSMRLLRRRTAALTDELKSRSRSKSRGGVHPTDLLAAPGAERAERGERPEQRQRKPRVQACWNTVNLCSLCSHRGLLVTCMQHAVLTGSTRSCVAPTCSFFAASCPPCTTTKPGWSPLVPA